jgi:hypothetical protein
MRYFLNREKLKKGGSMKSTFAVFLVFLFFFSLHAYSQNIDEFGGIDYTTFSTQNPNSDLPFDPPGWTNDTLISQNDYAESIYPDIEVDSDNNIHVVWKDNGSATNGIYYRMYDGNNWSSIIDLSDPGINSNSPTIAVDSENNVHIVFLRWSGVPYAHYNISYVRYDDSTGMWSPESVITTDDSLGLSTRPKVVTDSNLNVYVVWLDERDTPLTIWYKMHDGTGWGPDTPVTDPTASPNGFFGVTVAPNDYLHVCWQDYRSGTAEIYHKYYNGTSWSAEDTVTTNGFLSVYPRMAPDSANNIHLIYGGNTQLHYLMWDFQTQTWGGTYSFSNAFASPNSDIAVDLATGDIHLSFLDYLGYSVVFYKHYDAALGTWESNQQLTFTTDGSYNPQIALDQNNNAYVTWYDYRCGTGQEEVYVKWQVSTGIQERPDQRHKTSDMRLITSPNPFSLSTTITIDGISEHQNIRESELQIYDISGRKVREISLLPFSFLLGAKATWDGRDDEGIMIAPGIYFLKLNGTPVGKLIKIK